MEEDQYTIGKWAAETFGRSKSALHVALRANLEMAELLKALSIESPLSKEEVADVAIVLDHLAYTMQFDLNDAKIAKMKINRARRWALDGAGCGQHIE